MKLTDMYKPQIEVFEAAGQTWSMPVKITMKQVAILQPAFAKLQEGEDQDLTQLAKVFAVVGDAEGNLFDEAVTGDYDAIASVMPLEVMAELAAVVSEKMAPEAEAEGN